jgi:hypothetical protein
METVEATVATKAGSEEGVKEAEEAKEAETETPCPAASRTEGFTG